jgi:hypothetical protein
LQELKKASLKDLIALARGQLEQLWVKCHLSPAEQNALSQPNDVVTDEVLDFYETQIARLEARYEEMKPILDKWEKRQAILKEKDEYERHLKDPNRFKKRFASKYEEQARNHIAKLPKISEVLYQEVKQWEIQHKTHFTIDGQRLIEVLEAAVREEADKKAAKPLRIGQSPSKLSATQSSSVLNQALSSSSRVRNNLHATQTLKKQNPPDQNRRDVLARSVRKPR